MAQATEMNQYRQMSQQQLGNNRDDRIMALLQRCAGLERDKVEIEVRVGALKDANFVPYIEEEDFELIQKFLHNKQFEERFVQETDYFYPQPNGQSLRIAYDEKAKRCLSAIVKDR
jgi:hypothetical protein